jgi:hypothetical protein
MKARLVSRGRIPYGGGYRIRDPLSGQELAGTTFAQVLGKAVASRKANGLPIGLGFAEEVEDWCCASQPTECQDVDPLKPRKKRLTLDDMLRGARVLLSFKLGGSHVVSSEEAERRAAICSKCYMNSGYQRPCSACHELADLARSITGGRQTSLDRKLHACHVCGCSLQAAVWLELKDQCKGVDAEMRREFHYMKEVAGCWKTCDE